MFFGNRHREHDPVWHVQIAMLVAICLQIALPGAFVVGSRFAIPLAELLLLAALSLTTPREKIANYADNQLQVKGGILIGIWDEQELAAIKDGIAQRGKL